MNVPGQRLSTSVNGLDNTPANNPVTNDGATLGRVLFYDKNLSANGEVACASCHIQAQGFSDDATLSVGFAGGQTARHSMTLINARYYQRGRFFWDERATTLEDQVLQPFQDPVEMGMTLDKVVSAVESSDFYPELFTNAFGSSEITSEQIAFALAQFVRSIVSYSSRYDEGRAMADAPGDDFVNFTAEENLGKRLFLRNIANGGAGCFGCHTTEAFVSANPGPMHDGRFATLEEVVEHYNGGIQAHPTLSPVLTDQNGDPIRLNLSDAEKAALVAFLKTLTDDSASNEVKWSDPFI